MRFCIKIEVGLMKIVSCETRSWIDENNTYVNRSWIDDSNHKVIEINKNKICKNAGLPVDILW